jgi:hypothetical protein
LPLLQIDGIPTDARTCGTNEGLGFGRFSEEALVTRRYVFTAPAEDVIAVFSTAFDDLVREMRADEEHDSNPSALRRMGYPKLRGAFAHPRELSEVINEFLGRDILAHFVPYTDESTVVINSIDALSVTESAVTIEGRCFARPE